MSGRGTEFEPSQIFGGGGAVLRMDKLEQGFGFEFSGSEAEGAFPNRIQLNKKIIETSDGEQVEGESEKTVAPGFNFEAIGGVRQRALMPGFLDAAQAFALIANEFRLVVKIDQHL